jgi:hypothetical protein
MKDIPEIIFLQVDDDGADAESFKELETTYCDEKIYENDIEYILKSKFDELLLVLKQVDEAADYWSEYDVPITLKDNIKNVLNKYK